jgi:hypothetical protein
MSTQIIRGNIKTMFAVSITADVTSRTANTTTEFDITVPGVAVGDIVICWNKGTLDAGASITSARVKSANTVATTWVNATASGVDPASQAYTFVIGRPETPAALPAIVNI